MDQNISLQTLAVDPLTFLGGTFYSVSTLPPFWRALAATSGAELRSELGKIPAPGGHKVSPRRPELTWLSAPPRDNTPSGSPGPRGATDATGSARPASGRFSHSSRHSVVVSVGRGTPSTVFGDLRNLRLLRIAGHQVHRRRRSRDRSVSTRPSGKRTGRRRAGTTPRPARSTFGAAASTQPLTVTLTATFSGTRHGARCLRIVRSASIRFVRRFVPSAGGSSPAPSTIAAERADRRARPLARLGDEHRHVDRAWSTASLGRRVRSKRNSTSGSGSCRPGGR